MTTKWQSVKWSEPSQVLRLAGGDPGDSEGHTVESYYYMLLDTKRYIEAVDYVAHALSRYQAVAWAARTLSELAAPEVPRPAALKAALLWVQDPTEARRRAAFDAASGNDVGDAEKLVAFSIYFSGGSIAPDGQPPVAPPRDIAGRLAAAAVKIGVFASKELDRSFALALQGAEALAVQRLEGSVA